MKSVQHNLPYELHPPDGGWGYIVAAALALACNVTVVPMACFGIIFGNFLSSIGDETAGTTLANGIFNTVFNFTGLAANSLLQKYTYRKVGAIGAGIYFIGAFATTFVVNLPQMILSFGIIQGIGMGLMFPAFFTALNCYFDKKLNLINGLTQAVMVGTSILFPAIVNFLMENYGFRGTVALMAALSLNGILAAVSLQPAEWHFKKVFVEEKLLEKYISLNKPRASIISVGDRAISVTTINQLGKKKEKFLNSLLKSFDLSMFKDPVYVNISVGLSLGFTSDVAFISLIPLILLNAGFDNSQITLLITIYFSSDLVARILLSIVGALCKVRNRLVFLGGCVLIALVRTAFVLRDDFLWKMVTTSLLGFLRCFIQTPLPLVISDQYSENFSTAFSLYMVVCGFVSLLFGPLISLVKSWTQSDIMVVHLLSLSYLICAATWTVELLYEKSFGKKK